MTQNEFFNTLMDGLKDFPEVKLQDIISYYEHYFTTGLEAGKTENDMINELGNPNLIVNKLRDENLNSTINIEHVNNNVTTNINADREISDINNSAFIKDQNVTIHNKSNDVYSDFKSDDKFNNTSIKNENNSEHEKSSSNFKTSNSDISTDDFYDISIQNISSNNEESNYKAFNVDNSNYNFHSKDSFNYNNINDSNFDNRQPPNNFANNSSKLNTNIVLKVCIVILTLIIFSPVITGIIGFIIGLFGIAIGIFAASIGVLVGGTFTSFIGLPNVPAFVANFPYPVIVLFSLGSISLSILLIILFYYLCKFFILTLIKISNSLKSKGGAL